MAQLRFAPGKPSLVIPARAGIQLLLESGKKLDSGFRRNDELRTGSGFAPELHIHCAASKVQA
jgi:hypothetical protein